MPREVTDSVEQFHAVLPEQGDHLCTPAVAHQQLLPVQSHSSPVRLDLVAGSIIWPAVDGHGTLFAHMAAQWSGISRAGSKTGLHVTSVAAVATAAMTGEQ